MNTEFNPLMRGNQTVDSELIRSSDETKEAEIAPIKSVFTRSLKLEYEEFDYDARSASESWLLAPLSAPMQLLTGTFNKVTIVRGALGSWEFNRVAQKKVAFQNLGGVNLSLNGPTGRTVDGCYLSCNKFFDQIEGAGGTFQEISLHPKPEMGFRGTEKVLVEVRDGEGKEISIAAEKIDADNYEAANELRRAINVTGTILVDSETGSFLLVPSEVQLVLHGRGAIAEEGKISKISCRSIVPARGESSSIAPMRAIAFNKNNRDYALLKKSMNKVIGSQVSTHLFVEFGERVYFIPRGGEQLLSRGMDSQSSLSKYLDIGVRELPRGEKAEPRGTVIISQDQISKFEQRGGELITFLMAGMNVMAYNTAGKGESEGPPSYHNINASLEAAYLYVSREQQIPDERILAKGTCFGAAPTAWLGKKYPSINVMVDQNPSNFWDIAIRTSNQLVSLGEGIISDYAERHGYERDSYLVATNEWLAKNLKDNFLISSLAKVVFSGYDVSADLRENYGHKLININEEDFAGWGGDDLVPEGHPSKMVEGALLAADHPRAEGKIIKFSIAPGGKHITSWWTIPKSNRAVRSFLEDTGLSREPF